MNISPRSQSLFPMILEGFHYGKCCDTIHFNDTGDVHDRHKKSPSSWMNGLRMALVWIGSSMLSTSRLCIGRNVCSSPVYNLLTLSDERYDALP